MDIESKILSKISRNVKKNNIQIMNNKEAQYFYLKPNDRYEYISKRIEKMKSLFLEMGDLSEVKDINHHSTRPFFTYGLLSSTNGDTIGDRCYIFNSSDKSNVPMKINLTQAEGYSIFNGQIAIVKGTNPTGKEIIAQKIYCSPILNYKKTTNENIKLEIYKGPFSQDQVENLNLEENSCIFFLGPFCEFTERGFSTLSDFTTCLDLKLSKYSSIKAFLQTSIDDMETINVYPQTAPEIFSDRVTALSNPCYFTFNSHFICLSNFDAISDLYNDEIFKQSGTDKDPFSTPNKITRMAYHMVFQKSLVPVLNTKYPVSYGDWLDMDLAPHLYIVSSSIDFKMENAGQTTIVNVGVEKNARYIIENINGGLKYNVNFSKVT